MAQPPGTVVWSFKSVGRLRLHRLRAQASFPCVHCRQLKVSMMVATQDGDWAQTLCPKCYGILVDERREKADRDRALRQPRLQTKEHQRFNGLEPTRRIDKRLQLISSEERRSLEHRLPGIGRLLAFFREAGIRAELLRGGCLLINGHQTLPLAGILPQPERLDWNKVIDAMAVSYAGDRFIVVVEDNARFGEGLRAFLRRPEKAFAVMRDDAQLATIYATRAEIPHRDVIRANFLKPGPHWQLLADTLHSAGPE